ncbi:MAG: hypothetical protein NW241_09650 [Bacteroidia bacterium]|nr:hypothetical protein [Bacteroidia bacterium]
MNPLGWIYLVLSLAFLLLGYLIGLRGRLDLLANRSQSRIRDRAGLARFMATHLLMGGASALLAILTSLEVIPAPAEGYVALAAVALLILWSFYISFESGKFAEPGGGGNSSSIPKA